MVKKTNTQGQSTATADKERCIGSAITIGMTIANKAFGGKGFRYWHLDANAGSGWNDDVDVPGSPLVFQYARAERLTDMQVEAFFCDMNVDRLKQLEARLHQYPNCYCLPGDNEEAIDVFAQAIRSRENAQFAVGSVVVDPNGYWFRNQKGEGAPVRALTEFSKEFPRIDIILNLNATAYKRQDGAGHEVMPPRAVLESLNKSCWLVRRTVCRGADFLLAVGRNMKTGDHTSLGFHHLHSDAGMEVMLRVEGKRQENLNLVPKIPDLFRLPETPGV